MTHDSKETAMIARLSEHIRANAHPLHHASPYVIAGALKAVGLILVEDRHTDKSDPRPSGEAQFDALVAAYTTGATDVHNHWAGQSETVAAQGYIGGPDFTEAAHEYARRVRSA